MGPRVLASTLRSSIPFNPFFLDNIINTSSFISYLLPTRIYLTFLGQTTNLVQPARYISIRCFAIISNSTHSKPELRLLLLYCLLPHAIGTQVLDTLVLQCFDHSSLPLLQSHGIAPVQALITSFLAHFIEYHPEPNHWPNPIYFMLCFQINLLKGSLNYAIALFKIGNRDTECIKVQPWHQGLPQLDLVSTSFFFNFFFGHTTWLVGS